MFLQQLKENIKLNSKPYAALRNEVVKYLISHEDALTETIHSILERNSAYNAAEYDIHSRFLSFSSGSSMDEALMFLLANNSDLVYELHAMMPENVDPKISVIAYQRMLTSASSQKIVGDSRQNTKNSFNEAQDFLSAHPNFNALAVHFKCNKRLGSIMEHFWHSKQVDDLLIKHIAVPFITLFDLESQTNISDSVMVVMISQLLQKLPANALSSQNVFQIESLLNQTDKKLLNHILNVFSDEKDGMSLLFNSITSYFFVDKYKLDISKYVFDLFIISSSEFSTGDAWLPEIGTWRNWICTCFLLEFSEILLKLSSANQIIEEISSNLIPSLQVSRLQKRLKDQFVKPFKDFYSLKLDNNPTSIIRPKWTWDENVVPLTEDLLIEKEISYLSKGTSDKESLLIAPDQLGSLAKSSVTSKVVKTEREHRMVDMLFRKSKRKEKHVSIPEFTETNMDISKENSKKGTENMPPSNQETEIGPSDIDRPESSEKQKLSKMQDVNASASEEKTRTKAPMETKGRITDSKAAYYCDIGSLIQESVQNIHKVFGSFDSGQSDIDNILSQFDNIGESSLKEKVLSIQMSLFQKEMTTSDIMQRPISEREIYFQSLNNLKSDTRLQIRVKSRKTSNVKQLANLSMEDVLCNTLNAVVGEDEKLAKSAENGAKVWKKSALDVQAKIWGRELSREELQTYLEPNAEDETTEQEKMRQTNRDEYLRRMNTKISKII